MFTHQKNLMSAPIIPYDLIPQEQQQELIGKIWGKLLGLIHPKLGEAANSLIVQGLQALDAYEREQAIDRMNTILREEYDKRQEEYKAAHPGEETPDSFIERKKAERLRELESYQYRPSSMNQAPTVTLQPYHP